MQFRPLILLAITSTALAQRQARGGASETRLNRPRELKGSGGRGPAKKMMVGGGMMGGMGMPPKRRR